MWGWGSKLIIHLFNVKAIENCYVIVIYFSSISFQKAKLSTTLLRNRSFLCCATRFSLSPFWMSANTSEHKWKMQAFIIQFTFVLNCLHITPIFVIQKFSLFWLLYIQCSVEKVSMRWESLNFVRYFRLYVMYSFDNVTNPAL